MDDENEDAVWVCAECIGEAYLKDSVETFGILKTCGFCGGDNNGAIPIQELANRVETAFETFYQRTSSEPDGIQLLMIHDKESDYDFERDGEDVLWAIAEAAEVEEGLAQALLDILYDRHRSYGSDAMGDECEFDPESRYERRNVNDIEFQLEWQSLERSIKSQSRFFNATAKSFFDRMFANLDGRTTFDDYPIIREAGPGTDLVRLSRARVFHRSEQLERALGRPDLELGPPPGVIANGGRMNARGVSMFYGATRKGTAIAEVRPPVGSRVLVGEFTIDRPLRLLDIEALRRLYVEGSIFDGGYGERLERAKFLGRLSERMTMPVMPDDEPAEYLITQVIADYLATNSSLQFDGLLYPSVQRAAKGQNVVLFHHASLVREWQIPAGSELTVSLDQMDDEGPMPNYWVSLRVPSTPPLAPEWGGGLPIFNPFQLDGDDREISLSLEVSSLKVHHVEQVKVSTHAYPVHRHESTLTPPYTGPEFLLGPIDEPPPF